ncbi:MAG TPA: hypothetical protein VGC51_05875 [Hansschlegelia sp.]
MRRPLGGGDPAARRAVAVPGEVLFEIVARGNAARCAATDVSTGLEVVVIGPADGAEAHLRAVALRKLRMRLGKS